jgi:hypothetical protein
VTQAFIEQRTCIFDDIFIALEWSNLLTRALGVTVSKEDVICQMGYQQEEHQYVEYFAKKSKRNK